MRDVHGKYKSIKALVFDFVHCHEGVVGYDELTAEVLDHFPTSEWKYNHWTYWRYQILRDESSREFSDEESKNLEAGKGRQGRRRKSVTPSRRPRDASNSSRRSVNRIFPNKTSEEQHNVAFSLARVCHHVHPEVVKKIQSINADSAERERLTTILPTAIHLEDWLHTGSACVFPGVRRFVGRFDRKELLKYVPEKGCIIDDNRFPRYLWTYLAMGESYNGSRWKETGLSEFELAHIFSHKPNERDLEESVFEHLDASQSPYSLFTCASNVALIPKGFAKPTDGLPAVRIAFFRRHVELYGEEVLPGLSGLREERVPDWYDDLEWNEPIIPDNWEDHVGRLMEYRHDRLNHLFSATGGSSTD